MTTMELRDQTNNLYESVYLLDRLKLEIKHQEFFGIREPDVMEALLRKYLKEYKIAWNILSSVRRHLIEQITELEQITERKEDE